MPLPSALKITACTSLLALTSIPAIAQYNAEKAEITLPKRQVSAIERTPDRFLQQAIQALFSASSSGLLTKPDLENFERRKRAQKRARVYSQILVFDLDGDISISADEYAEQIPYLPTRSKAKLTGLMAGYDSNRDGVLSRQEIIDYAQKESIKTTRFNRSVDYLFSFDLNGDGMVRAQEIADMLVKIKDGEITLIEAPKKPPIKK